MARDWNKSNTEYVRQFWLMPDADLDAVGKNSAAKFRWGKRLSEFGG